MIRIIYILIFLLPSYIVGQEFSISSYVNTNEIYQNEYVKFIDGVNVSVEGSLENQQILWEI